VLQTNQHQTTIKNISRNLVDQKAQDVSSTTGALTPLSDKTEQPDRASYKRDDVSNAISEGAQFLPDNPRQVKRFINLFRLYVYIADARNLLRFTEDDTGQLQAGLDLKRLAIWVAWSIRWAEIVKTLLEEVELSREELRAYLLKISEALQTNKSGKPPEYSLDASVYDDLLNIPAQKKEEENSASGWYRLPWQRWLLEKDFLKCIKEMESFWQQPQESEDDWLEIMITMNRVTFSASTNLGATESQKLDTQN
jgi:hypothetical protein